MNVLQVIPYLRYGAGRSVLNLSKQLKKRGHNSVIITSKYRDGTHYNQEDLLDDYKKNDIEVFKVDNVFKRNSKNIFEVVPDIIEIIKKRDINLINAHAGVSTLTSHLAIKNMDKKIPLVSTVRALGSPHKKDWQKSMDNLVLNCADKVIAISNYIKGYLIKKGIFKGLINVIHNGVKAEINYDLDYKKYEKEWDLQNNFVIGAIGRLNERKNQTNIIKAINLHKNENIKLLLVGSGEEKEELVKLAQKLDLNDKIEFVGFYPKARKLFPLIDLFVLTPLSEAFGLVFAEALLSGTPAIGSSLEGVKDIIKDGENGFLVPPQKPELLAEKINFFLNKKSELERMGKFGVKYALERFTVEAMGSKTIELYKSLL